MERILRLIKRAENHSLGRTGSRIAVTPSISNTHFSVHISTSGRGDKRISVYDRGGNLIRELLRVNGSGNFVIPWDLMDDQGRSVPAGTYFLKMTGFGDRLTAKIIVVE